MTRAHSHRLRIIVATLVLFGLSLIIFAPGYVEYDSVGQYAQVLSGDYDDWHPPIMARLWSLFAGHGAGPMLAVQLGGWWLGLGGIAAGIVDRRPRAALLVLAIGLVPPWLGWQVAILKDAQMTGATLAAVGIVGWWRLRGKGALGRVVRRRAAADLRRAGSGQCDLRRRTARRPTGRDTMVGSYRDHRRADARHARAVADRQSPPAGCARQRCGANPGALRSGGHRDAGAL
ncbi:hypothetical protein P0F65_02215 [Sphingomonas sp. I4]